MDRFYAAFRAINAADLTAGQHRYICRLLEAVSLETGTLRISRDGLGAILGASLNKQSLRNLLNIAKKAGLIDYQTDGDNVWISWESWENDYSVESNDYSTESNDYSTESNDYSTESNDYSTESKGILCSGENAAPIGLVGRSFNHSKNDQDQTNQPTPQTPQTDRTLAMLTDEAIGIDEAVADDLARTNSWEFILRHCLAYLREENADGPGLLIWRIRNSKGARPPGEQDRASAFYRRHVTPEDEAKWTEAAYTPSGFENLINS